MDSSAQIKSFLDRVRKQRKGIYLLQGLLRVLALVLLGALTANLIAYFSDHPQLYLVPFLIAWGSLLGITLLYLAARGLFAKDPPSRTALWVENRVENLDNALISSVQLEPQLKERPGEGVSQEMIRELIRRTSERIQNIRINELISKTPLSRTGQWTVGVFLVALACALILPDFWTRGYDHWIQPPALARVEKDPSPTQKAPPAVEEIQYRIEELGLTFHYPAYTRKKTTHQKPSNGKIRVLPGTEILLRGKTNHPVDGASLVLNGQDHFSMSVKDQTALEGRFIAKEPGFYQFRLKSPKGKKTLLPRKYPVRLLKDRSPRIIIFLANPKPVYYLTNTIRFFYEASDDFGLRKIDLVIDVEGRIERKTIKRIKGHRQGIKGDYSWELATM
ncbi:MAG: hypothetical protein GWM98_17650, partial [Nitrospinaceae bacterium]|nr:hypothetical protein [Nitrospinaceae bacterium]NIR55974.1 hypothetical protein [Nitrospinaceae bacterium]NIS86417.1 hypothetical protein [Nitrospinaceae bacterium]NIT83255.1 hypothetical protein [Nitrospinaceae bacterium]NIU45462.1 hypothetical protein [Nitrospinaceae bacterium]